MGKLLAEAWRWAQSFYSPFQSSSSQKVLLLARPFSRRGVSKGTGTLHRPPEGKAPRTVQQRSTRKYECYIRFLDEVTGTPESQRPTPSELHQVVFRELLATARQPAKASSAHAGVDARSNRNLSHELRCSTVSQSVWVVGQAAEFQGTLTRSNTICTDKNIQSRPVVVSSCCHVREPSWLRVGWKLLSRLANFDRDFLLPTPSGNLAGCLQAELRCDTGFAIMNRLLAGIPLNADVKIQPAIAHFWTPHSGRAFMPSSTAALGFCKEERNFLGGWQAQASDRCARILKLRVRNMQKSSGPNDPEKCSK